MNNAPSSADDHLIEQARETASEGSSTPTQAERESAVSAIEDLYARLSYVNSAGCKFSRERD